ncbi:hypothetical protein Tco_0865993 [Tanacetum coccineum]
MENDLFTYKVEVTNIPCNLKIDDDSEHEADDDMGYDPSDIAFIEWLASKFSTTSQWIISLESDEFEDPDGCGECRENEIFKTIINKLHDEWFKGTDEDDDDLEGIIDYLEPTLYDGFIDSDDEEYKERKCRLLGMPYIKPPLILIEKVNVTRYSIGLGEVYRKIKIACFPLFCMSQQLGGKFQDQLDP